MSELEVVRFELPLPPNPNSSRWRKAHWSVRYRDKKQYFAEAYVAMMAQGIRFPREPWKRARVDCKFHVWNLLDEDDNLPVRRKAILDFLTCQRQSVVSVETVRTKTRAIAGTGFFEDDSPRNLDRGELEQIIDRSKATGSTVEITIRRFA